MNIFCVAVGKNEHAVNPAYNTIPCFKKCVVVLLCLCMWFFFFLITQT